MKICIIGFPRSRSSLLLETISKYYSIPLLGEDINSIGKTIPMRDWIADTVLPPPPDSYYTGLKLLLLMHNRKQEGVIRLHPLQLSFMPYSAGIINFDIVNFKQYDTIYFTSRNDVDTVASLFVAGQLNTFTYKSKDAVFKNIAKMTITDNETIRTHIISEIVVDKLKKYLATNNINFTELDYDMIPQYIEGKYPDAKSYHVETNYDYKSIITNYDDIDAMLVEQRAVIHSALGEMDIISVFETEGGSSILSGPAKLF